jgi:TIR domain
MSNSADRPIFVSYSREDADRSGRLVDTLTDEGLSVFWDGNIGGGQRWRDVIPDAIYKAASVVVLWTKHSVQSNYVREEAGLGGQLNILMPVMFEGNVDIPFGFRETQCFDLSAWAGERSPELNRLVTALRAMVERRRRGPYHGSQPWNEHTFDQQAHATSELQSLSGTVRELGEVLAENRPVTNDVNATLDEVGKSYGAVRDAIEEFLSPAFESGPIDGRPYLRMEDGSLETTINKGLGHCTLILTLYRRHRGLRDAVARRVDAKKLQEIDSAFDQLSTADGDLFQRLSSIGWMLTAESEVIATLLTAGRTEAARERIRKGRENLQPLRKQLTAAINELQEAQRNLGYAGHRGR